MKLRKRKSYIIIPTLIIAAIIAFGLINSGDNDFVQAALMLFTDSTNDSNQPPASALGQPGKDSQPLQPDPEEPNQPDSEQAKELEQDLPEPSSPANYVNQQPLVPTPEKPQATESKVIYAGLNSSASKQIALTFDAGWLYDQTLDLLDVLDQHQVKATFFLRGQWVKDHPEIAKEIYKRGHSVENHSLTHGHMKDMTDSEILNEISITTNIIKEVTGYQPYLFRPPYGEYDSRILKMLSEQGYPYTVKWTVDSLDWAENIRGVDITEQYLIDRVLNNASNNGIVLMHVGGYQTVKALPEIIEGLRQDGYELVKVNDMLPKVN